MNIEWSNRNVCFEDLSYGDVFKFGADAYIKTEDNLHGDSVGVRLCDGKLFTFGNKAKLLKIDAKVVVNCGAASMEVKE